MALTKRTSGLIHRLARRGAYNSHQLFAPLLHRGGYLRHTHKLNKGLTTLCRPCQFTHSQGLHKPTDLKSVFRASYDEPRPRWPPPSPSTQRRCSPPARRPDESHVRNHLTPWLLGTHLKASYDLYRLQAAHAATTEPLFLANMGHDAKLSPTHYPLSFPSYGTGRHRFCRLHKTSHTHTRANPRQSQAEINISYNTRSTSDT